jgi:WD40 repeat protein
MNIQSFLTLIKTGECKFTLRGHAAAIHSLQIFEKQLISGSLDHSIRVWDLKVMCLCVLLALTVSVEPKKESYHMIYHVS